MTDVLAGGPRPAHSTVDGSPFPPIAEYGFLSNREVCALVAPSGNVEWMCLPRTMVLETTWATAGGWAVVSFGLDLHAGTAAGQDQSSWTGQ